jgi:hypothetical protein
VKTSDGSNSSGPDRSFAIIQKEGDGSTSAHPHSVVAAAASGTESGPTVDIIMTTSPSELNATTTSKKNSHFDMSVNYVYTSRVGYPSHPQRLSLPGADHDEDDNGISTSSNGTGNDLNGHGRRFCSPVIVNQTRSLGLKDLDKWTRTLVKISQCISSCMQRRKSLLSPSTASKYYNVSSVDVI